MQRVQPSTSEPPTHTIIQHIFTEVPSGQDKFRMCLYVDTVLRLLNINDKGWFNDEIFTFFAKILNLHQEYCPTTKTLHVQVPQVIFCNRYNDSTKINPMFKTQPY